MLSTSVIYDFLHRFLTDVECIIVNIDSKKPMLTLNLQHRLFNVDNKNYTQKNVLMLTVNIRKTDVNVT